MAPAAVWAALAVGLQLWAAGRAVQAQMAFTHSVLEASGSCQLREFYDKRTQRRCSQCPPGCRAKTSCNETSDTVCVPCEDSTYTQLWNWLPECLSCGSRCGSNQVETQACTLKQNRICTCRPGWYCMLPRQEGCQVCMPLRKCHPGFGVAKPGTATSNVVCAPCAPGTFSDRTSSTDTCRPHRKCSSVAIPGNASMDAVCTSGASESASVPQPGSTRSQHTEPTPGPSTAPSTSLLPPVVPSPPAEGLITGNISIPIGLIVGVTALGLLVIGLVNCIIVTQKKKKRFCLQGEAKVPHLPADKAGGAPGPEQQHLLTAAQSSSSSSLESSASAADKRAPAGDQLQAPGTQKASGSGEARASSSSSAEPSPGGHGTQVNVTCIVNVCSSSGHGSQCPSQTSSTTGDTDASPSGSPKDEQVPFSKEECPCQSPPGAPETLQQNPEEKPLPLGVPDAGMKSLTRPAWDMSQPRSPQLQPLLPAVWCGFQGHTFSYQGISGTRDD
ncbi:tumor necrosis factor receptor superfamily member 1B isoform X1 [Diceros bicornis minor]|uniref:tumor necrosis factor receptor superfamily member 1B isoform X1 n=1 Tax=Diceros bicornis minor TaxID=77932 RepID=UPI0026ED52A7|nr:tumor necrosis factor receptor superfamily member 1B isoform X1 [Diceros bicornis minor]